MVVRYEVAWLVASSDGSDPTLSSWTPFSLFCWAARRSVAWRVYCFGMDNLGIEWIHCEVVVLLAASQTDDELGSVTRSSFLIGQCR